MRIIGGEWRGRVLQAPKGDATRPTADRTREGLFSMLISRIGSFEGLRVADLFAGSGALGFEALSRGAATCTFVEQDRAALAALRANAETLRAQADIRAQSVMALGSCPTPYDIVFIDAPYDSGAGAVALDRCTRLGWVGPSTLVSMETRRSEAAGARGFDIEAERVFGKAKITLLRPSAQ